MFRIIKVLFISLLSVCLILYFFNFENVNYGIRQAKGQFKILFGTVPVEELLKEVEFPDSLRNRIDLIYEIKKFTVDSLGLNPSNSYQDFYDQKGEPILWVISASPPYSLESKKWTFPIVGTFLYKGHFKKELAIEELTILKKEGWDVRLSEVSAWSTLGYLSDPILSSMLNKSEGELASLIIHELTHGTLFVKNDLAFNENLADFIGMHGALLFLHQKYGSQSDELIEFRNSVDFNHDFTQHMLKGAKKLDSLFQTFSPEMSSNKKDMLKVDLIKDIMSSTDTLNSRFQFSKRKSVNNAFFTSYLTYQGKQSEFEEVLLLQFNGNFKEYLKSLKANYKNLGR